MEHAVQTTGATSVRRDALLAIGLALNKEERLEVYLPLQGEMAGGLGIEPR